MAAGSSLDNLSPPRGQFALWCRSCGASATLVRGFCAPCYAAQRHDLLHFGGWRGRVLERDRFSCRVCGEGNRRLHVHHRRPGVSREKLLIALCPAHHAQVHRLPGRDGIHPARRADRWREQHPGAPEQLFLDFGREAAAPPASAFWLWEDSRAG
jgi:hypothetical protein